MKNKLITTIFAILTIFIFAVTIKDIKQDREAAYIQNNIQCYQLAKDGDMQITLKNGTGYYFNIYKDTKNYKLFEKDNNIYLYLNNNLSIQLGNADINKVDITQSNYSNYKSSFITLHTKEVWNLANEEAGINTNIGSYIHYLIYNC